MKKWKIVIEGLGYDDSETYMKYMICFINAKTVDEVLDKLDSRFNFHNNPLHYQIFLIE